MIFILLIVLILTMMAYACIKYATCVYNAKFTSPVLWFLYEDGKIREDYFTDDWTMKLTGGLLDRTISYNEFMKYKDRVISYAIGNEDDPFTILSFMVYKFYLIDKKILNGEKITIEELAEFYYAIETSYKYFHDRIDERSFTIMAGHLDAYICYIRMYDIVANSDHAILEGDVIPVAPSSCYDLEWFRKMASKYNDSIPHKNPPAYIPRTCNNELGIKRLMGF